MKLITPIFRVLIFAIIALVLFELIADSGDQWAFQKYPVIQAIFWGLVILAIFIEIVSGNIKKRVYNSLSPEAQERYTQQDEDSYLAKLYEKLKGEEKSIEEEGEIILDHDYDGIKELDNNLPPWWVYLFYITILYVYI